MAKVLFVCLGNICRSPLAEGIFDHLVKEKGLEGVVESDSAGTAAYHLGKNPDPRSVAVARKYGIRLDHRGRQFVEEDFEDFDYIIPMDQSNMDNIRRLENGVTDDYRLVMMRDFDTIGTGEEVPDPYYGGDDGFENVYKMLRRSCERLLDRILDEQALENGTRT
ncbi:phosphotyrosine protein phosphatase [Fulvitalea axinellae]|uniref:protein-tyrosine-phosphatase n=1 Tax=Fulvitalea axinellae TaxID=1182444 RepID=A0AAU9CNM4_9BACT|nr:phosphotyrosine protein phosphatase [Fulvitalea axinellae]